MSIDFQRQSELVAVEQLAFRVTLIGAGGIGSPTALALGKLGCSRLVVLDPDRVEPQNLPNQLYGPADIGKFKVDALGDIVERLCGTRPETSTERVVSGDFSGVVILAVDTMAARKAIWHAAIRYQPRIDLFIDARMGGEVGKVLAVCPTDPDDVGTYESSLHEDALSAADPCLVQAIGYSTLVIAGLVASVVRKHAVGIRPPVETIIDLATLTLISRSGGGAIRG